MSSDRPDWFGTIVSAGKHGDDYVVLAVDADGNIVGVMKGTYSGSLLTIAVDDKGYMQTNVNMIRYGETRYETGITVVGDHETATFTTVNGKGTIYDASMTVEAAPTHYQDKPVVAVDGVTIYQGAMDRMAYHGLFLGATSVCLLSLYDTVNGYFVVLVGGGYSFDESLAIGWQNVIAGNVTVSWSLRYALVE